jgi:hypothetical protein
MSGAPIITAKKAIINRTAVAGVVRGGIVVLPFGNGWPRLISLLGPKEPDVNEL